MAMRDVRFFVKVAQQLSRSRDGAELRFISFYQAGNAEIRKNRFHCYDAYAYRDRIASADARKATQYEQMYGIANLHRLILHEKVTSANFDDIALEQKFMVSLDAADAIMRDLLSGRSATDVSVIQELGGFLGPLSVFFACRRHGVEHVFLEPSFFRKRLHFVRNSLMAVDCAGTEPVSAGTVDAIWLQSYLDELRRARNPVVPDKDVHHFKDMGLGKIVNWDNLAKLWRKLINKYMHRHRHEFDFIWRYSWRHARMYLNRRLNALLYTNFDTDARAARYVYFPFHVQLDYALTIRCPEYLNQLALVDYLCSILPSDVSLYIKEHPASIGGFGYGELRRLLHRHKNLRLIHPSVNSYDLAEKSSLIVTINSKAGAEALVMGKPVIVLGDAFYTHSGLATYVANPRDLEQALRRQLSDKPIVTTPQQMLDFFQRVWRHTYAGELYNLDDVNVESFAADIWRLLQEADHKAGSDHRSAGVS
jgi:hypothetical protein